jgi:hypothetical protein
MVAIATLIVLAFAMTGCSDLGTSAMPTSPTTTDPAPGATGPVPVGRIVRTELWTLALTMREVYGAGECDAGIGTTRQVVLRVEFSDQDAVAIQYESDASPAQRARWTGWIDGDGVEASGVAFERLPCSAADASGAGALTMLTGYFSTDGQTFSGTEMRRHASPVAGEIVYYFDWHAHR